MKKLVEVQEGGGVCVAREAFGYPEHETLDRYKVSPEKCLELRELITAVPQARCVVEILIGTKTTKELLGE